MTPQSEHNMRITNIELKNWKNFREINAKLARRVFIIGINAAGKSNFLDAFRFMKDIVEHGIGKAVASRGGLSKIRCLYARRDSDIRLDFEIGDTWKYELELCSSKKYPLLIKKEKISREGEIILDRPDPDDHQDEMRLTQTALEQVSANKNFRAIADLFKSIEYRHILPQAVRDPQDFSAMPVVNDPYGRDIVRHIWNTKTKTREIRLKKLDNALRDAVPNLKEFTVEMNPASGQPHLTAKFLHWRSNDAIQDESSFSDGTLRLIALFWMLMEKGGPLLLEEPELSLHEEVVKQLPGLFAQLAQGKDGRQVLVSTHSYALLSDAGIQPEEIITLEPTDDGTILKKISKDANQLMKNGLSVAEAILPEISYQGQLNLFKK